MAFHVVITDPADQNFREHFTWIQEHSVQGADHWRRKIIAAVRSLDTNPERHALAGESSAFPVPIRCLLVGKRRSAFRILYHIADNEVRVLAIRRPAQGFMKPLDLE